MKQLDVRTINLLNSMNELETTNQVIEGDLDLSLPNAMGSGLVIMGIDAIQYEDDTVSILSKIINMSEEEHMKAYESYDIFHDGGDDFDYGQSYLAFIVDLIALCETVEEALVEIWNRNPYKDCADIYIVAEQLMDKYQGLNIRTCIMKELLR